MSRHSASAASRSSRTKTPTPTATSRRNRRAMLEAIDRFKSSIEAAIRMVTTLWYLRVIFRGTQASTDGHTIILPAVNSLARHSMTDEDLEDGMAYLIALRGYAWHETSHVVETDMEVFINTGKMHGRDVQQTLNFTEDIRIEHRFSKRDRGIEEALHYMREMWLWPRIARKLSEAKTEPTYLTEAFLALQVAIKFRGRARRDHVLWKALPWASRSWALRSVALIRATREAYEMPKEKGTQYIADACLAEHERWAAEHATVAVLWPVTVELCLAPEHIPAAPPLLLATVVLDERKYAEWLATANPAESGALCDVADAPRLAGRAVVHVEAVELEKAAVAPPSASGETVDGSTPAAPEEAVTLSTEAKRKPPPPGTRRTVVFRTPDQTTEEKIWIRWGELLGKLSAMLHDMIVEKAKSGVSDALNEAVDLPNEPVQYLVYSTEHDVYATTDHADADALEEMRAEVRDHYGFISARLQALLRTQTRTRRRGGREEGTELDHAAISNVALAQHLPIELRPFMYETVETTLKATVVGLMVDGSGSMFAAADRYHYDTEDELDADGKPKRKRRKPHTRLDLARIAALCFGDCLDQGRIEFALWGFSSNLEYQLGRKLWEKATPEDRELYGRFGGLYIETAKGFDEVWANTVDRVPNLCQVNDGNYDADSVWWAGQQLLAQRHAKRRVLYVFSDGAPQVAEETVQTRKQTRHLRDVVLTLRELHVETVGVGIADRSVLQFYSPHCVVVNNVSDLPVVTLNQMEFLLLNKKGH